MRPRAGPHGSRRLLRKLLTMRCACRRMTMKKILRAALIAGLAAALPARAENFPSRPITAVVPFSAGGPSDALMRILAERMKAALGEAILVENTTGAGG